MSEQIVTKQHQQAIGIGQGIGNALAIAPSIVFIFEKLILVCDNWQLVYAKFYCDVRTLKPYEQWKHCRNSWYFIKYFWHFWGR